MSVGRRRRCGWSFGSGTRRYGAQGRGPPRGCRRRAFAALGRVSLHGRKGLGSLRDGDRATSAQPLACRRSWVRSACSCVSRERLPEHALGLLRRRLRLCLRAVLARHILGARHGAAPWLVVFAEQFDKVGGKQPNHAPVPLQPPHPPGPIASVKDLDQVTFYETKVALCLYR
jgi:hypothetical protein